MAEIADGPNVYIPKGPFRNITVDKDELARGFVIPVDAETGEAIGNVTSATIETTVDSVGKLRVELFMRMPYKGK